MAPIRGRVVLGIIAIALLGFLAPPAAIAAPAPVVGFGSSGPGEVAPAAPFVLAVAFAQTPDTRVAVELVDLDAHEVVVTNVAGALQLRVVSLPVPSRYVRVYNLTRRSLLVTLTRAQSVVLRQSVRPGGVLYIRQPPR